MGELNQQQKDMIKKLTLAKGQNDESNMQLDGCHRELGGKLIHTTCRERESDMSDILSCFWLPVLCFFVENHLQQFVYEETYTGL